MIYGRKSFKYHSLTISGDAYFRSGIGGSGWAFESAAVVELILKISKFLEVDILEFAPR